MPTSATIEITTRNRYHPRVQSHDQCNCPLESRNGQQPPGL